MLRPTDTVAAVDMEFYRVTFGSRVNGPGLRNVLHTQGCTIGCKGCFNTHTWAKGGGTTASVGEISELLFSGNPEGITISGGEPTEQWEGVEALLTEAKSRGLSTVVFTGRTKEELKELGLWASFKDLVDIAISGPYDVNNPVKDPLIGSANQEVHYLSDRYAAPSLQDLPTIEVHIEGDRVCIAGFPDQKTKTTLLRTIRG